MGLFIGASMISLYDISINYLMNILTKLKSRFGCGTEQTFEIESYEGQEKMDWNNSKHLNSSTKRPLEILSHKNQILIKLKQYEEKLFKIEKALNTLENKVDAQENIRNMQDRILQ